VAVTKLSFMSYTVPVAKDGTLPVQLFGRRLNFKRLKEKGIPWLICYGEKDELVEKDVALAPLDWVEAEVSMFPKGHVSIATSWSLPTSECSLGSCSLDWRGPVRYHLDLEEAMKSIAPVAPKTVAGASSRPPAKKSSKSAARPPARPKKPAKKK
jgi:hypothetical protein